MIFSAHFVISSICLFLFTLISRCAVDPPGVPDMVQSEWSVEDLDLEAACVGVGVKGHLTLLDEPDYPLVCIVMYALQLLTVEVHSLVPKR